MSQHVLTLSPTDVLFFRDGRPMEGASSGHGAAWPLPNVLSAAIHHALRRADHDDLHQHRRGRNGSYSGEDAHRDRKFGSLQLGGPFPVVDGQWLFPRPADAQTLQSSATTHQPLGSDSSIGGAASSLGNSLRPVVCTQPPTKETAEPWIAAAAYADYLNLADSSSSKGFFKDDQVYQAEHNIGIGIDPDTDTQDGERFYSASYLRLRQNVQLGLIAQCLDKGQNGEITENDLIEVTFPKSGSNTCILAGGQQRTCTVIRSSGKTLPLPMGATITGTRVRWVLLTPAIFPAIPANEEKGIANHSGGWLPTWIDSNTLKVQLKNPKESARKLKEGRAIWRRRVASLSTISAELVAATIPRALPVAGWAAANEHDPDHGGARATHLAVPAGAVYYFEADDEDHAKSLAEALNWHGDSSQGAYIINRRSTLMGEKGFGLGVCGTWKPREIAKQL